MKTFPEFESWKKWRLTHGKTATRKQYEADKSLVELYTRGL